MVEDKRKTEVEDDNNNTDTNNDNNKKDNKDSIIESVEEKKETSEDINRINFLEKQLKEKEKEIIAAVNNKENELSERIIHAISYANEKLILKILDFFSDFNNRFISEFKIDNIEDNNIKSLISGAIMIRDKLWNDLKSEGLEKININVGSDTWNSLYHEFFSKKFDKNVPELTIVEVIEDGYKFKDKVVKPAKVVINRE